MEDSKEVKLDDISVRNWPFKNKCDEIADFLYCEYIAEEKRGGRNSEGCGNLMLEWIKKRFWGLLVKDHIPIFNQTWDLLNEKGHVGEKNRYVYGDIDVGLWIEKVEDPTNKKVIASTRYCSMADDNTHLYIMSGLKDSQFPFLFSFLCRTVWPRQNKKGGYRVIKSKEHPTGWFSWGDDRDIKIPSIHTYRERDFDFSYRDCRDKGHVFTFKNGECDNAHWHENRIPHALWSLREHLAALQDYEANRCK